MVKRAGLVKQLDAALSNGPHVVIITAPAGYGKTTLVAQWLENTPRPCAWLTLDKADNDPSRFSQFFSASLQKAFGGTGESLVDLIQVPSKIIGEAFAMSVISVLEGIPGSKTIILDDYHRIHNQSVHEIVWYLIENQPASLKLAILTREDPPFPMARLRTHNRISEIRADQLAFTIEETKVFFSAFIQSELADRTIVALNEDIEGWPAGLRLAALSVLGLDDGEANRALDYFSGNSRYVVDYFGEEVLRNQTSRRREFLLKTSFLSKLNPDLCDSVTGGNDGGELLMDLSRDGLFLSHIREQGAWYRYHPLFADFLTMKLGHDEKTELHRKASLWYERHGMLHDALRHAVGGSDYHKAKQLVSNAAAGFLESGQYETLLAWIGMLSKEYLDTDIDLLVYEAWALYLGGRAHEARDRILQVSGQSLSVTDSETIRRLTILRSWIQELDGEIVDSGALLECIESSLSEGAFFTLHACILYGKSRFLSGDPVVAESALKKALAIAQSRNDRFFSACAIHHLSYCLIEMGRRSEAESTCLQQLQRIDRDDAAFGQFTGMIYAPLALCRYMANDLAQAGEYAAKAMARCTRDPSHYLLDNGSRITAIVKNALHDVEGALAIANEGKTGLAPRQKAALKADIALKNGEEERAARILSSIRNDLRCTSSRMLNHGCTVYLRLLVTTGRLAEAEALLAELAESAESKGSVCGLISARILQALCAQQLGSKAQALSSLDQALQSAEKEEYRRLFIDEGEYISDLLAELEPAPHAFAAQLLRDIEERGRQCSRERETDYAPIDQLSRRERDVMAQMAEGKSNQEIADTLFISLGTAKWHANNIYGKLGVKNRTSAINRARELGLIS